MYQIYDTDIYAQPDERLLTEERNQQLDRIINSLSEKLKTCIILFYYNNMTIKQIADILGCSEGTVKSRLFKAKRAIEKKMKSELVKGSLCMSIDNELRNWAEEVDYNLKFTAEMSERCWKKIGEV